MAERPTLNETLEKLRSTIPEPRKDGTPRIVQFQKREQGFVELLEALVDHVAIRDGLGQRSQQICRGCGAIRETPCPLGETVKLLKAMGRSEVL